MFKSTHLLVSRSKQIPVHLVASRKGFFLVTQSEWEQNRKPAFEIQPQRGFFCQGIPVLGYSLQPIAINTSEAQPVLKRD
jgi:hypothetical protein